MAQDLPTDMEAPPWIQTAPRSIARRQFLRTTAGATAGMASWLALGKAPAFAQKRELTFLSWNHFVPASDDELRKQAEAFGKANNCTVRVDTMAHLQMPSKVAAEAQSQSGHDMYRTAGADPFLYENLLVTMDDVVEKVGKQGGGWYNFAAESCQTKSGWKAIPWFWVSFPGTYNMAHFKKAGFEHPPKTWDELLKQGKVLKKQGNPVGIPISHCSDAHSTYWSVAWSYGAKVLEADGKTPGHQSPTRRRRSSSGTRSSTRTRWSRRSCPGTTPATTASSSPARAPGSTTRSARTTPRSPTSSPSPTTSTTTTAPAGPAGIHSAPPNLSLGIWKFSKNQELAKEFIVYLFQKQNFDAWIVASNAFNHPPLKNLADHPIWARNPKFAMLPKEAEYAHPRGWPAKPSEAVQRIDDNYIMADMVAKAVNGMPTKRAMDWAQEQVALAVKGQLKVGSSMAVGPRVLEAAGLPGPGRRSRLREWWEQEHVFGYGLIVPAIVLLVTLVAFPFGMAIYFSLSDYWVGLARRLRRPRELPRHPRQRDLPPDRPELVRVHRHRAHPQDRARRLARDAPVPQPPLQAHHPRHRAPALRHPDGAVDAGVAVDVRLALQRRQLDRHPRCT